ncbi:MAG: GyrI-like domain-containing protein, partial [Coprobacillaceae bacterium]
EENLDKDISYDEAANIACCSTSYFQRMFTYGSGISLSEYIRRRKMTQAAFILQTSDAKILDIALLYGYTSPTAFNRAFQSVHGISPSQARKVGSTLNPYYPIAFSVQVLGGNSMPYRIEEKGPMRVVGVRTSLVEEMEENQKIAPIFWQNTMQSDVFKKILGLRNQEPEGILGLTTYERNNEMYYYIAVSTDKDIPKGMDEYTIPATTWVIFESHGPFKESVRNIYKHFLTQWLPFSGYTYTELPDIEVYPIPKNTPSNHTEVWIAIKKEEK